MPFFRHEYRVLASDNRRHANRNAACGTTVSMSGIRVALRSLLTISCLLAVAGAARAQASNLVNLSATVSARDPAAAEALFRAGRQLLFEARFEDAYAKFEESYRLDPTAGALFNMGECRLNQGKSASAWALYKQAATLADVQGKPDLMDLATSRANQLQVDLSYLTFHVAQAVPGLEVMRDGVLVGRAQFDVSLPVDPGRHSISLRAPGYESLEIAVIIGEKHDRQTFNVPKLNEKPLAVTASPSPPPVATRIIEAKPNTWPWAIGGVGAASLLVGSVSGILAISENHRMAEACPARMNCSNDVLLAQGRRDLEAQIAWIGMPVGIAALGSAATWLLLSHQHDKQEHIDHLSMAIITNANGRDIALQLGGSFQ